MTSYPPIPGAIKGYYKFPFLYPSFDDSGETDKNNINTALAAGLPVFLMPWNPVTQTGNYVINGAITPVSGSFITGFQAWNASEQDYYGAGNGGPGSAYLYMTYDFADAYAIDMYNATGSQYYGVDISGLSIYGEGLPSHLVNQSGGIRIHGAWGAGFVRHIAILGTNGDGVHCEVDDGTGAEPDEWRFEYVKVTGSYGGYGWWADNIPDSRLVHCQGSNNALDGFRIGWSTNTALDHCKAEQNNNAGFHMTGTAGTGDIVWMTTCTTHLNQYDGFLFDASTPGEGGQGTYQLANCGAVNDAQAGGTVYAGYRSNGNKDRIMAAGCSSQQAYYGASETSSSYGMCFTGSWLSGTSAATHDDASNTHVLVNQEPVPF